MDRDLSPATAPDFSDGILIGAAVLIGCVSALMVPVWRRLLTPLVGDAGGLVLAVLLAGAGIGFITARRFGSEGRALPSVGFAIAALAVALPPALGDRVATLALLLRPLASAGGALRSLADALPGMVLALPASIVLGALLSRLVAGREDQAPGVGHLLAVPLGAAAGVVACNVGLLPALSIAGTWRASVGLLAAGAITSAIRDGRARRRVLYAAVLTGLAVLACATGGPTDFWLHGGVGVAGTERGLLSASFDDRNDLRRQMAEQRRALLWAIDGVGSGVAFERSGCGYRLDGVPNGGLRDAPGDAMSGLIGAALHPAPRRVLVLGLGSATSAGWLATSPEVERVDVVEHEPALERIADLCAPLHHDVLSNPKVHLIRDRTAATLRSTSETYDLILAPRFDPEIVEAAARRLEPGGLFLQRARDAGEARTALEATFPAIEPWRVQASGLLLIAGRESPRHDLDRIRDLVSQPPYRAALDWLWGVEGVAGFYSGSRADVPPAGTGGVDWAAVANARQARELAWGLLPANLNVTTSRESARRAFQQGDLRRALVDWRLAGGEPRGPLDRLLLAESSAELSDDRVQEMAEALRVTRPAEAAAVLARRHARRREPNEATDRLLAAFHAARESPWAHPPTLQRALDLAGELAAEDPRLGARLFAALAEPFALGLLDDGRLRARVRLTGSTGCARAFAAFEPHPPWEEDFLRRRQRCYESANHQLEGRAARDLRTFRDATPPRLEDGLLPEED